MKGEAWRWAICAAIVAAAHGLAWRALSTPNYAAESDAGSPVVTLELSPLAAAPAPPPDESRADAQPAEAPAAIPAEPPPGAAPVEIARETPPLIEASTLDAVAPPQPPAPDPPKETPAVVAPPPPAPPPSAQSVASARIADVAAAPNRAPGREEDALPAALHSWRQELIAQIERNKRFPADAAGRSGVATIAFDLDAGGRLIGVRLVASSGSRALDQAALDLIQRAQPFPAPPEGLAEGELRFVAPIRFFAAAR